MSANEQNDLKNQQRIPSEEMTEVIRLEEEKEQVYSIALFDILGFSNFVQNNGTQTVLALYNKLLEIIHRVESNYTEDFGICSGSVVLVPISNDWKKSQLVANANGYIRVCHFSDTFLIYTNYLFKREAFWLRDSYYEPYPLLLGEIGTEYHPIFYQEHSIYLSFLQICMEFFCEAVKSGIPIRGCISTGAATMNKAQSVFFGRPLVEAARGESAQNAIGAAFGRSFANYHPVYNRYCIPYPKNIKENDKKAEFLSPMVLDWPRFWRSYQGTRKYSIEECIKKMNTSPKYSHYYDNAIEFADFSAKHENWPEEIAQDEMKDILEYYERVKIWFRKAQENVL